jgi:hypothetical protein
MRAGWLACDCPNLNTSNKSPRITGRADSAALNRTASAKRCGRGRPADFIASDSETSAAFGTTGANDGRTTARAHANEETVGTLTLDDGRLEGALHVRLRWHWGFDPTEPAIVPIPV